MGLLIDGEWSTKWYEPDEEGHFVRSQTRFRAEVSPEGRFKPELGRYHLYVSLACPWAHRTLIVRKLMGLEEVFPLSVVDPLMTDQGWHFSQGPGCVPDALFQADYLRQIYLEADSSYTGRVTVPVLWDKEHHTIVNNESRELIVQFATAFASMGNGQHDLYPEALREDIDRVMDEIYDPINNGVYRAGFATTQKAYQEAVHQLFDALERWEAHLGRHRYLCGSQLTLADWCMFTTLFRFDPVYHYHFKCNLKRLRDFPNLWEYTKELYQMPGVAQTCNLDHIKDHYYRSHPDVNPTGVVPAGPEIDYSQPWSRVKLA
jgi:putative glutathione S-transferase